MPRHRGQARVRARLSQNFLVDPAAVRTIVRAAQLHPSDLVLEPGPGAGALTRALLREAGRVRAYELDQRHARRLSVRYRENPRISIEHRDFRTVRPPAEPFAVVANIPFAASTDILRWCLEAPRLTAATLLTQREFARKHSGDYGRWSRLTVTHWPQLEFALGPRVGRHSFHPVPAVEAAVLLVRRRTEPLLPAGAITGYRRLVDLGFTGRGGSFAASLAREYPRSTVRKACCAAQLAPETPVGLVHPRQWLTVHRTLTPG
ncbi:23S ribosomal RNA methyltransferase Erm [Nocardia harenae]|uniref:23S ribosomal RNA methyltransferase Erm n=1 Tax=Nocardia harenae TaxID=358707 RepID=UPI0008375251|nr:23S ribosomal RNA methyltransferase Erm [Nocardia harenae]